MEHTLIINETIIFQGLLVLIALGAAGFVYFSLDAAKEKFLIDNLPTSKTTGVFIGLVELKGVAYNDNLLTSYLSQTRCVYYRYEIEEESRQMVTETYTDGNGRIQTREREERGWVSVAQGNSGDSPFILRDDCGEIRIQPKGATIEAVTVLNREGGNSDPLYGKGPQTSIPHSTHTRRFTEVAILQDSPLYVVGHARLREDVVAAEIAADARAPMYLISTSSEQEVSRSYRLWFWILPLVGLLLAAGALTLAEKKLLGHYPPLATYLQSGAYFLGAWLFGWLVVAYNSFVDLRNRVDQGWANIDVQLKRRAELIPNLIELVTGLRDHEQRVQSELAILREQMQATAPGEPGPNPAAITKPMRAIAESYPELKSNEAFLNLQKEIANTEERIALARSYFNDIATHFNTRLGVIPDGLVARIGGMRPRPLLDDTSGFERAAVRVRQSNVTP